MTQIFSLRVIWACCLAVMLSFNPTPGWGVVALKIQPEHEYEAAFCLGLLSEVDTSISFDGKRKIQLAAESLSFAPQESMVSHKGRLDAAVFVSEHPDEAIMLARMNICNQELSEILKEYVAHSCGFGIGSLASKWSMSEVSDFHKVFEGRIALEAIDGLRLR